MKCFIWNFTSGFDFHHVTAVGMSFSTSVPNRPHPWQKNVMPIFKMAGLRRLEFYGSNNGFFEKPMYYFIGRQ